MRMKLRRDGIKGHKLNINLHFQGKKKARLETIDNKSLKA